MSRVFKLLIATVVAAVGVALGPVNQAQAMNVNSFLYTTNYLGRTEGMVFSHPDRVACIIEVADAETSCQFEMSYKNYNNQSGDNTFMNFEPQDQTGKKIGYAFTTLIGSEEWKKTTVYIKFPSKAVPQVTFQARNSSDQLFRASSQNKPVVIYHQWPDSEWELYDSQTPFFSEAQFDLDASGFSIEGGRYNFFVEVNGNIIPKSWTGSNRVSVLLDLNADEVAEYAISTPKKALKVGYATPASLINKKTGKALSQKNCDADAWLIDKYTFAFSFMTKCVALPMRFGYQAQVYDARFRGLDVSPDVGLRMVHRNFGSDVVSAYAEVIAAAPVLERTAKVAYKKLSSSKVQISVSNLVGNGKLLIQRDWSDVASIEAKDSSAAGLTLVDGASVWVKTVTLTKGNNIIVVYQDDDRIARYELKY